MDSHPSAEVSARTQRERSLAGSESVGRRGLPGKGHMATDRELCRSVAWPGPTMGTVWPEQSVQGNS